MPRNEALRVQRRLIKAGYSAQLVTTRLTNESCIIVRQYGQVVTELYAESDVDSFFKGL